MSQSIPGRAQSLFRSSIGLKLVMGVTGVILVGFALVHMAGNLQVYLGANVFNSYAQMLKGTMALVWAVRVTLLVAVGLHIWAAVRLTGTNWTARPRGYESSRNYGRTSYAALFMRGSGVVILAFLVFHILHFTVGAVQHDNYTLYEVLRDDVWVREANEALLANLPAHHIRHDAYSMFVLGFQNVWVSASYIVAMVLLGSHLSHGVASMLATLGYSTGPQRAQAERIGATIAAVITLGNLSFPIAVLAGVITL